MSQKKYWKSVSEKQNPEKFDEGNKNEFQEKLLPIEELDSKGILEVKTPRRDFLKYLGFSTGAALLAAGCKTAVVKSVPFLSKPPEVTPGKSYYYATTYVCDNDVVPVLAKVRDGRPIKIEGNDLSQITKGGTTPRVQGSILSLYDNNRLRYPVDNTKEKPAKISYRTLDNAISEQIDEMGDKKIAIISPSVSSRVDQKILEDFVKKYPSAEIIYNDPISYESLLQANQKTFNTYQIPSYKFDRAQVIVSLDADFLGTWLSGAEFSNQWAKNRQINKQKRNMSKHYQIEPLMSITGANADKRMTCKPSQMSKVALALYDAVNGDKANTYGLSSDLISFIKTISDDLKNNKGRSLVVSGSQDENVQILVNAMNQSLENYGNTISWTSTFANQKSKEEDFNHFLKDLEQGNIGAVFFVNGSNPVYNNKRGKNIADALPKAKLSVSFSPVVDETSAICNYIVPHHHPLESWGDASLLSDETYFLQPTIAPLFETRYWQETFLKLTSNPSVKYENYFKNYWKKKLLSQTNLNKALQKGLVKTSKKNRKTFVENGAINNAIGNIKNTKTYDTEVVFYQKIALGSGTEANNPWLQEMPDPITKTTWDNYAVMSPSMVEKLGITLDADYEVNVKKPVVEIEIEGQKINLPINVIPGTNKDVIGIAIGYGRAKSIGNGGGGVGENVYPYLSLSSTGKPIFYNAVSSYKLNGEKYTLGITQSHNSYEGRTEVVKETTLDEFKHHPKEFIDERVKEFEKYGQSTEEGFIKENTLYPQHDYPAIKWGMSIDLNLCTGCNACVVACNAENNVSVVGKKQVVAAHEMHWLRIDRYFSGDSENPDVVFQPMMCQHCDNAPCENVCPVSATNHSSEGLNQMIYNRCIGTRYCANNCPFKVRRFNWANWTGAGSFKDNQVPLVEEGYMDEVVLDMNSDLTRMVLNPDVTVRSRGVMEKCTFCVQRLQSAKLKAKMEKRPLEDGDVQTACMQACPTKAIEFGNVHNENSKISTMRKKTHKERLYYVLEQLHVLPNINYLAKIRNKSNTSV